MGIGLGVARTIEKFAYGARLCKLGGLRSADAPAKSPIMGDYVNRTLCNFPLDKLRGVCYNRKTGRHVSKRPAKNCKRPTF